MAEPVLVVACDGGRTQFAPGEELSGQALWEFAEPPKSVEVRLVWFTRGKGTPDGAVIARQEVAHPGKHGECKFRFRLPATPYSFSGRLISLIWGVELFCQPGGRSQILEIVNAPGGQEVRL